MPDAHPETHPTDTVRPALPADLEAAVVELLAEALVAELMATQNSAETQGIGSATGESPSGHVRTTGGSLPPAT